MSSKLTLNVEDEPTDNYIQFTASGHFVVGDFFKINEDGYTLKQADNEKSRKKVDAEDSGIVMLPMQEDTDKPTDDSMLASPAAAGGTSAASGVISSVLSTPTAASSSSPSLLIPPPASPSTAAPISSSSSVASTGDRDSYSHPNSCGPVVVNSLSDLIILGPIGQGASGLVQKVCTRSDPSQLLALKVVPLDLSETKSKQILIELRTLHYAQHPNIVSFYGAFYKERSMSLVLEYMDLGALSDCLKRIKAQKLKQQQKRRERRLQKQQLLLLQNPSLTLPKLPPANSPILSTLPVPEAEISCIARQLLAGLHYLHSTRRLIHRDIKPSNILLNSVGEVKLADFGVSGELAEAAGDSKVSFVGTVSYMSPERIQGHPHSFDSDLWSLGLSLVELALGYFPYAHPLGGNADAPAGSATLPEEESSEEEEDSESDAGQSSLDEEQKDASGCLVRRKRPTSSIGSESPSSSASSTPSHASLMNSPRAQAELPFSIGPHAGIGALAARLNQSNDLYNATQTHLPSAPSPVAAAIKRNAQLLAINSTSHSNNTTATNSPQLSPSPRASVSPPFMPQRLSSIGEGTPSTITLAPTASSLHQQQQQQGSGQKDKDKERKKSRFGFWDIMQRIVQSPAPLLSDRLSRKTHQPKYSPEFRNFVAICLNKDPKQRSTAAELLRHPFILEHSEVTLHEWIKSIPAKSSSTNSSATACAIQANLQQLLTAPSQLRTTSHIAPHGSPSHAALASPIYSAALPPLPHRRGGLHQPRGGNVEASPRSKMIGTQGNMEEESEIETFPVTPSVASFASVSSFVIPIATTTTGGGTNAFESVPIAADVFASSSASSSSSSFITQKEITVVDDVMMVSASPTAAASASFMSPQSASSSTLAKISTGFPNVAASAPSSGSSLRLKRKTTMDISVDVDEEENESHPVEIVSASSASATGTAQFNPVNSAPASTRRCITEPPETTIGSASASPPSGRIPGATPLKRQKSAELPRDVEHRASFSGIHAVPIASAASSSASSIEPVRSPTSSSPPLSASERFAANLRLARATNGMESLLHLTTASASPRSPIVALHTPTPRSSSPHSSTSSIAMQLDDQPNASVRPRPLDRDDEEESNSSRTPSSNGRNLLLSPSSFLGSGSSSASVPAGASSKNRNVVPEGLGVDAMARARSNGVEALISPFTPATGSKLAQFSLLKDTASTSSTQSSTKPTDMNDK